MSYLRYIGKSAEKFASIRYPETGSWSREECQRFFEQVDGHGRLEIVDEDGADEPGFALQAWENGASPQGASTPAGSNHPSLLENERG